MANNAHIIARQIAYDLINTENIAPTYTVPPPQEQTPTKYVVINPGASTEAGVKQQFGQTGQLDIIVIERQLSTTGTHAAIDTIVDAVLLALKPTPSFTPLSPAGANTYIWYIESVDGGIAEIPQGRNIFTAIRLTYTIEFESLQN